MSLRTESTARLIIGIFFSLCSRFYLIEYPLVADYKTVTRMNDKYTQKRPVSFTLGGFL